MNSMKVYISCPKTVPQETLSEFAKLIRSWGADVCYWARGSIYKDNRLREADAVVVLLPNLVWKLPMEEIPMGTRGEIKLAKELGKPLYLGYITTAGNHGVYRAMVDYYSHDTKFVGIAGTYEELSEWIHDANEKTKKEIMDFDDIKPAVKQKPAEPDDCWIWNLPEASVHSKSLVYGTPGGYDKRLLFRLRK